jgi:hypothetical protein
VGTNALVLGARVHAASLHDRDGGQRLLDDTSPSRSAAVAPRAGGETTRLAGAAEEVGRGEDFRVVGAGAGAGQGLRAIAGAMIYWAIMSRIMLRAPRRSVPSGCSEHDWECGFKALCKTVSRGRVEPREYSPNAIPGLCGGPGLECYGFPGPPWLLRERVAEADTPEAIEKRRRGTAATTGPGPKDWRHLAVQVMLRCAAAQALPVGNSNASSDSGYISIE